MRPHYGLAALILLAPATATADTYVVNSTGDEPDCNHDDGVCAITDGADGCLPVCTLRAALGQASADPAPDSVEFALPAGSIIVMTDHAMAGIPASAVSIDGTTTGGRIEIWGSGYLGYTIVGPATVSGIDFLDFASTALLITGDGAQVFGCGFYDNGGRGLAVAGGFHQIGVPGESGRNTMVGNDGAGIVFDTGSNNTIVTNNWIGTWDGEEAHPNGWAGIRISGGSNLFIGGELPGEGNVVSGNGGWGIQIFDADGVAIMGNRIGLNADGTDAVSGQDFDGNPIVGNESGGIFVAEGVTDVSIGAAPMDGSGCSSGCNAISGNPIAVAALDGVTSFEGNVVGTDVTGTVAVPNDNGVRIFAIPGGVIADNVISGNLGYGLQVAGQWDVGFNVIGLSANAQAPLPNGGSGLVSMGGGVTIHDNGISGGAIGIELVGPAVVEDNDVGPVWDAFGTPWLSGEGEVGLMVRPVAAPSVVRGNVFGGWQAAAIYAVGTPETPVEGLRIDPNWVGIDHTGMHDLPNAGEGIVFEHVVGGNIGFDDGSTIVNTEGGCAVVVRGGAGVEVRRNRIGLAGGVERRNACGVLLEGAGEEAPLDHVVAVNEIAHSDGLGVSVLAGDGHRVTQNAIWDNADHGIRLGWGDDDQIQDMHDLDDGPNGFQNAPVLEGARETETGRCSVRGELSSSPNQRFLIELFRNDACGLIREGKAFVADLETMTDGGGVASFEFDLASCAMLDALTATATDVGQNTSPFSDCATPVTDEPMPDDPDRDDDGVVDALDNCPDDPNPEQEDADDDGLGDACDDCPEAPGEDCPDPTNGDTMETGGQGTDTDGSDTGADAASGGCRAGGTGAGAPLWALFLPFLAGIGRRRQI